MDTSFKQQLLFRLWGAFLIINVAFVMSLHLSGVSLPTAFMTIVIFALVSCGSLWFLFQAFDGVQDGQDSLTLQLDKLLLNEAMRKLHQSHSLYSPSLLACKVL